MRKWLPARLWMWPLRPSLWANTRSHIGASVGVAMAAPNESASQLLARADAMVYEAKAGGLGRAATWQPSVAFVVSQRERGTGNLFLVSEISSNLACSLQSTKGTLMAKSLPAVYAWLDAELGPRILTEFIKVYGIAEKPGPQSNPTILEWAKIVGLEKAYRDDAIAWCGLAMAYVAGQAGWDNAPRGNALLARNWQYWGNPADTPMLGDVLVFWREDREGTFGHVGVYVG